MDGQDELKGRRRASTWARHRGEVIDWEQVGARHRHGTLSLLRLACFLCPSLILLDTSTGTAVRLTCIIMFA